MNQQWAFPSAQEDSRVGMATAPLVYVDYAALVEFGGTQNTNSTMHSPSCQGFSKFLPAYLSGSSGTPRLLGLSGLWVHADRHGPLNCPVGSRPVGAPIGAVCRVHFKQCDRTTREGFSMKPSAAIVPMPFLSKRSANTFSGDRAHHRRLGRCLLRLGLSGFVAAASMLASLASSAVLSYRITDLGLLPGGSLLNPSAINDSGQVVGYGNSSDGNRAFLWSNGTLTNLGALPGALVSGANGISNAGTVVGSSSAANNHAFIWQNGVMAQLSDLPSATFSIAGDINNLGQIVGVSGSNSGAQAVTWNNGVIQPLGTLSVGGTSVATDINDSGIIVGTATNQSFQSRPVRWDGNGILPLDVLPGATDSGATGINNAGRIVGFSGAANLDQPVQWFNGAISALPLLAGSNGGRAYDLNEAGQIVGFLSYNNDFRATLWDNGVAYDLTSLVSDLTGWNFLDQALAINELGQITGYGFANSGLHGFILTPNPQATIPEPSSALLLLIGLVPLSLASRRWRA